MAVEIKMPQLSDTMSSGKILAWRKNIGDAVSRGDVLAEVETDKANLEIESFNAGTLLEIKVPANDTATVGQIIAIIGQAGEKVASSNGTSVQKQEVQSSPQKSEPAPIQHEAPKQAPSSQPIQSSGDRIKASPLARKIAEQRNIDLRTVTGSGPNGRIVKDDLGASSGTSASQSIQETRPSALNTPKERRDTGSGSLEPLTKMRDTIARRMQESVTQAPHFYVTVSVNMDEAVRTRELLKAKPEYKGISINHLVIKASAYGLQHEPRVNRAIKDGMLYTPNGINIGIITAIEDGLLIPVIHGANELSLRDLVFESRAAVERARAGRPSSTDLTGGTFSISNMGMFDVDSFTAIINPGQGGVLAVSAIKEEPVVKNGQLTVGKVMRATVSVDHRVIDGVMAGNFLKYFKEALETPALLIL